MSIKFGSTTDRFVHFGGTRSRVVFKGSTMVYPGGRSQQFYNTIPNNSSTGWKPLPVFDTREFVPRNSLLAKTVVDANDGVGVTVYDDIYQWTIDKNVTGTWRVCVDGTMYNNYSYAINQPIYGGYATIGTGSAGTDQYVISSTLSVALPASGNTPFYYEFTFTKSTTSQSWYILPTVCIEGSGTYTLPRIERLTIGMRRIS